MKIIALCHTLWTEMLADCWSIPEGMKIIKIPIPSDGLKDNPELLTKLSRLIVDMAELEKPSLIVDINGAGILPLDNSFSKWTATEASCPWIEWWWDDPMASHTILNFSEASGKYFSALRSKNIYHFLWDSTITKEFSVWLGKDCVHLPTAVHPGVFNPDSARLSNRSFPQSQISFLGTFYRNELAASEEEISEAKLISEIRTATPDKTYFDILELLKGKAPSFTSGYNRIETVSPYSENILKWRNMANHFTGLRRRNEILVKLNSLFERSFFCGFNWPSEFNPYEKNIYHPAQLSSLYNSTFFNIDLQNGQSFTGTNMRFYEIMSCGAVPASSYFPDFDPDGKLKNQAYIHFNSPEELKELYGYYSSAPEKIKLIKENARTLILEKHSWLNRLQELISALPIA